MDLAQRQNRRSGDPGGTPKGIDQVRCNSASGALCGAGSQHQGQELDVPESIAI
jgi:hypothetical protein